MKSRIVILAAIMLMAGGLAGCATGLDIPGTVAKKIAAPLTKAVFGLAVEDAKTTLAWVEAQVKAGALGADDAKLAKACPQAVLDMSALREKLVNPPSVPTGFKGVIYNATLVKFGSRSIIPAAKQAALAIIAGCSDLAPNQLILGF